MRMSEKFRNNMHNNNNSDNPLTSRCTDGGKNGPRSGQFFFRKERRHSFQFRVFIKLNGIIKTEPELRFLFLSFFNNLISLSFVWSAEHCVLKVTEQQEIKAIYPKTQHWQSCLSCVFTSVGTTRGQRIIRVVATFF